MYSGHPHFLWWGWKTMPTFIAAEIYSESSFDNLAKMDRQYSLPFSKSHICQLLQNVKEKEDSNQSQAGSKQVHTLL